MQLIALYPSMYSLHVSGLVLKDDCCPQVHGDVFRPPTNASLLSVYVGTGMQLIGMGVVTMVFAVLGFLSPANRGGLMTAMLLLFVFMGVFGGYYSARLYKIFKVRATDALICFIMCGQSCTCFDGCSAPGRCAMLAAFDYTLFIAVPAPPSVQALCTCLSMHAP